MKKLLLGSTILAAIAVPSAALAQAAAAPSAPPPEHTLTGNMTIATDYRFRGISQTFGEGFFTIGPAIQGGIDYSHSSGFYLGNWNSNVSGNTFPNGSSIEMDFYGGWKGSWGDWGLDVGTIYYYYPGAWYPTFDSGGNFHKQDTNNWEVYVGGSWKWFSAKYFYSVSNYFGLNANAVNTWIACNPDSNSCTPLARNGNTKGTQYLTGAFNYEIMPKLTLGASLGYTWVNNYGKLDYLDYKLGLTYDLAGWLLGANLIGTDADKKYWYAVNGDGKVRDTGTFGLVLSIGKTF
jgi:uncharacterized protein (TIGR02001 family)